VQEWFDPRGKRRLLGQSLVQELYTVTEAAEAMRISPKRVRTLINKGELRHVQLSKRGMRIPKQAIIDYLAPSPFQQFFE